MNLPPYAVDFRGHPACPCQVEWIPVYEAHLNFLGIITGPIPIDQLIGLFAASGDTHADGGASDFGLFGHVADQATAVARQMGADASWHRPPNWDGRGGVEHIHSVLRGCPHLSAAAVEQIIAVDNDGDGLVGAAPDPGPRPLSGRTWREGIAYAHQQEDDMPSPKDWSPEDWALFEKHTGRAVWLYKINKAGKTAKAALEAIFAKVAG